MAKKVNKEEPTFEKQLEKYSKDNPNEDDPIFSHAYQEFLVKLLKTRDKAIISEVIEFVADNDTFAEKVANKVREHTAEAYMQLAVVLKDIQAGQITISNNIVKISDRLTINEEKVVVEEKEIEVINLRLDQKKKDIKQLRDDYEKNKQHLEYVAKVRPTLEIMQKVFTFWTWKKNWKKIIGVIIASIIIIFILFWMFLSVMKFKGFVSLNGDKQAKKEWVDKLKADQARGYSIIERGSYIAYPSKAYTDSVDKADIERLTKEIDALTK